MYKKQSLCPAVATKQMHLQLLSEAVNAVKCHAMESVECSRPTDQPLQNSCHQTGLWFTVQHMSVYQPIADVNRLLPPTDSHRICMVLRDRVDKFNR